MWSFYYRRLFLYIKNKIIGISWGGKVGLHTMMLLLSESTIIPKWICDSKWTRIGAAGTKETCRSCKRAIATMRSVAESPGVTWYLCTRVNFNIIFECLFFLAGKFLPPSRLPHRSFLPDPFFIMDSTMESSGLSTTNPDIPDMTSRD